MAAINVLVPRFHATQFTGGTWCVLEYASGLAERGHDVRVIPVLPSDRPQWFPRPIGQLITTGGGARLRALGGAAIGVAGAAATLNRPRVDAALARLLIRAALVKPSLLPLVVRSAFSAAYVRDVAPAADVNLATSMETARPTALLPKGRGFYFVQHLETLFQNEYADPAWAALEARQSYHLGLTLIATSPWLRDQLQRETSQSGIPVCSNGIDHTVFTGTPKGAAAPASRTVVISYGGRNAEWKGFREMCEAVADARRALPGHEIVWQVYGGALLPPDNAIAGYEPLGFLQPAALADAYRAADILLSASWYESFPFFPIEAMACGLAVITTQPGTEAYAIPGKTAEVVEPRNAAALSAALVRLVQDRVYRATLAAQGREGSRAFTWPRAVAALEAVLLGG